MLLIDCHSDIVIDVFRRRQAGERAVLARRHLPRLRSGRGGLTRLGAAAVELMAELGVIVDLAHASPRTIREALALGTPGVIVSHANAAALHPHARNLDDDQAAAIAASGGFIGVCAYPGFVGPGDVTIEHVADHIVHFVNNLGARHVGIGADFLDYLEEYRDIRFPTGLRDAGELGSLIGALSRRQLAPADIAEVAGNSLLRVLDDVAN